MKRFLAIASCCLVPFCFAKQNAQSAGPFQQGSSLKPLATVSLKTAEISVFMPEKKMLFVVGQGDWEDVLLASTRNLQTVLDQKGIHAQFDYWGHDVDHDWPWWYIMVEHYLPQFLY